MAGVFISGHQTHAEPGSPQRTIVVAGRKHRHTGGIGFYLWRSLPYHHAIWHLLMLAGSAMHYVAVLNFVIPGGPWGLTPDSCELAPGRGYLMPE